MNYVSIELYVYIKRQVTETIDRVFIVRTNRQDCIIN